MGFKNLIYPESIAVVGASSNSQKVGHAVLKNILDGGFEGPVYPINPKSKTILGTKCYSLLQDVPGSIDCAVIIVNRNIVPSIMKDCAKKGVKAAIVISSGFGETDEEGKKAQNDLVQIAELSKITMMGPNCLGLINPWQKLNAAFGQSLDEPGEIALISQSGALIASIQDWAKENKVGFSLIASIGNKAAIDEVDFFEYLKNDENTKVIASYLEDISRGQEFMRIAERVGKVKPIVILKSGRSEAGAKAASSHTGSLAGSDAAYDCAFQRLGVIRAESIEHLFDICAALAYQPLPKGNRIAVITNAGGPGIMMSDALELSGLKVINIDEETKSNLLKLLPPSASVNNPIDVLGDADKKRYGESLRCLLESKSVDGVVVILTPQKMTDDSAIAEELVKISKKYSKPVITCFMGADTVKNGVNILRKNHIPQYSVPRRAAKAMLEMVKYNEYKSRPLRIIERFAVNTHPVIKIIKSYRSRNLLEIGEFDAKTIMESYGMTIPEGHFASSSEEAVRFANEMRYPVAMKISSPDILHKSDVGGVKTGLGSATEVEDAFDLMMLRVKKKMPEADIRGVLVEEMITAGKEVILGMKKDPQFGPMLMFGLGGIFVEVLKDISFSLAPITAEECKKMIENTKTYKLLTGVRGQRAVDIQVIVTSLLQLSQLVIDFPEFEEVDINPLKVGHPGEGAFVVDARIILSKESN
jgi:acetyl coenzyme A synthetase (ADP forming)-like protein